jgi:hypothetical protein
MGELLPFGWNGNWVAIANPNLWVRKRHGLTRSGIFIGLGILYPPQEMKASRCGHFFPLAIDESNDCICHTRERVRCDADKIIAQEDIFRWKAVSKAGIEEPCHI